MAASGAAVPVSEGVYTVNGERWTVGKRYILHHLLGAGGYGQVCLATDTESDLQVALKRCPDVLDTRSHAKGTLREVCILRRLLPHENLIQLKDLFTQPAETGRRCLINGKFVCSSMDLYISLELATGGDLYSLRRTMTVDDVRGVMRQCLVAARFLHHHNIWHRDIKSANVLIAEGGVMKFCDFGCARSAGKHVEEEGPESYLSPAAPRVGAGGQMMTGVVATPCYRAPEVIMLHSGHYTQAIDLWGLGCIFGELLQRVFQPNAEPLFRIREGELRSPATGEEYQRGGEKELDAIFDVVGTPTWGYVKSLPSGHWRGFLERVPGRPGNLRERFHQCGPLAVDLLARLLDFDPSRRPSVEEAMAHSIFDGMPAPPPLPPRQDNSLWGTGMLPPPLPGAHPHPQRPVSSDVWDERDPARALEALEMTFQATASDADKGEARLRAMLQRECEAMRLHQRGFFFGQKPPWWEHAEGTVRSPATPPVGGAGPRLFDGSGAGPGMDTADSSLGLSTAGGGEGSAGGMLTGGGGGDDDDDDDDVAMEPKGPRNSGTDDQELPGSRKSAAKAEVAAGDLAGLDAAPVAKAIESKATVELEGLAWLSLEVGAPMSKLRSNSFELRRRTDAAEGAIPTLAQASNAAAALGIIQPSPALSIPPRGAGTRAAALRPPPGPSRPAGPMPPPARPAPPSVPLPPPPVFAAGVSTAEQAFLSGVASASPPRTARAIPRPRGASVFGGGGSILGARKRSFSNAGEKTAGRGFEDILGNPALDQEPLPENGEPMASLEQVFTAGAGGMAGRPDLSKYSAAHKRARRRASMH